MAKTVISMEVIVMIAVLITSQVAVMIEVMMMDGADKSEVNSEDDGNM